MKRFVHFWLWLRKRIDRQNFGSTSEQKLLESLEKCAKLKEYKFTLQWVRLRLHLLKVQYDPWKIYFIVTWKTMDTSTFRNCLSWSEPWLPEKNCPTELISKNVKTSDFLSNLYGKPLREKKAQVEDWRQSSHLKLWLTLQEQLYATLSSGRFWNCCDFFQRISNIHNKRCAGRECPR